MTQAYEYGMAVPWLIVPIVVVAVLALAGAPFRDLLGFLLRRPDVRPSSETRNACLLAATLVPMVYFSPALWGARYQIAALGVALALVAWATGRGKLARLGEGVAGALAVMAIISFFWAQPRWWYWPSEAKKLASIPWPEREVTPASEISPDLGMASASSITKETGLAREKQLAPGSILAMPSNFQVYIALFWNNEYSNKVVWVPEGPDYLARVAETDAMWLYCSFNDPMYRSLKKSDSGWAEIGPLNVEHWGAVFRRTKW
jgi:hypothetical protein